MRLRPALAITAALIPAALMAGTTASATESPAPSASASPAASDSPTPSASGTPSVSATAAEPVASTSSSSTVSPPSTGPQTCPSEPGDEFLSATVAGETRRFVAGGGWHGLTIELENVSDTALRNATVEVVKNAYEMAPDAPVELQEYVNIQRWDEESRTWAEIPWDQYEMEGQLPPVDIAPRKSVTLKLRMSVEKDFPHGTWPELETKSIGTGYINLHVFGIGEQGVCGYGEIWYYNVVKPGTETGDAGESTPPSSSEPTPQTGATATTTTTPAPTGDLAHTGSSSALPVIGLVGGTAVVLGAGALYAVRRRRAGTDAA
ncbi:LPXTG cell wall anchor domain-containing protein [Streptomyces sp. Y7]|uniref:LPXTG cell wall anchor domain-containing protein n=1 Tax=Streptomyces sp. Y7 TaxID=3342392 RepID=UPI00372116F1